MSSSPQQFDCCQLLSSTWRRKSSLFEVRNDGQVDWQVHDFGEVLFGRDSLPWAEMQKVYWPFDESAGTILLGKRA